LKTFHWSLYELDKTDVESLFDLMNGINAENLPGITGNRVYGDQVDWC
jgi:hypothetical protein